jgi:putative membrane protein
MLEALKFSLAPSALVAFVVYLVVALAIMSIFKFLYTRVTSHNEFALIKQGNVAAAVAFGGAIIGFALPASNIIAYSAGILDFVVWALIAAIVQVIAFLMVKAVIRDVSQRIEAGDIAIGIYLGATAIAVGFLNAACMTPSA